jgi:hypothetical protein
LAAPFLAGAFFTGTCAGSGVAPFSFAMQSPQMISSPSLGVPVKTNEAPQRGQLRNDCIMCSLVEVFISEGNLVGFVL